jgi:serine/threonine-protein kinase
MNDTPSVQTRAIGRYTILRELRRERHSVSYAAVDPVMNRQLVVKAVELLPAGVRLSPEERKRVEQAFVRQAQAAGRLQHPHIITVFDAGLSHAFGFLVIERINGRPLHELLAGGLRPAFVQCASIAARIADALECAHSNGVAHGHLGPQHVHLLADGSPKVSGFGGWIDDGASGDEALAGTERLLPYFQNEITEETRQADVRALGQLLFMMLTGRAPPATPVDAGAAAAAASPTLAARPDTPPALVRLVDQSLLADPGGIARSAGVLRDALTAFIWNERTDNVAPNSLGIPLAAPPPQRPPVHVATISAADSLAPLAEPPSVAAAREAFGAPAILNGPTALPVDIPNPLVVGLHDFIERVRPWATRNRLPLSAAGALLSVGIFLGVLLGNLRHPEAGTGAAAQAAASAGTPNGAATAGADAGAALATSPHSMTINVPVSFDVHPWGEIFIDGKPTGVTPPLTQVSVPVGHHHFEIRHGSSPAWQTDIDVQGTTTVRIEHNFAP